MTESSEPTPSSLRRASGSKGRFVSLDVKIMASVVVVVVLALAFAVDRLGRHARAQLIESKTIAASMVTALFAESVSPAVDFAETESIQTDLEHLRSNRDVVYAGVWSSTGQRLGEYGAARGRPSPGTHEGVEVTNERLSMSRLLRDPTGKVIGAVRLDFSVAPENRRYLALRREITWFGAALALGVCAVVFGAIRLQVLRPLSRLVAAAQRLEHGNRATVTVTANDQIGRLGRAFNTMARAIVDRERSLAQAMHRIQELLDTMRQAIVVFALDGRLESVHSRQAQAVFGDALAEGASVLELLYPDAPESVEADAFAAWLAEATDAGPDDWRDLLELAPRRVTLHRESGEIVLALEFIPVEEEGEVRRVMLLATDETDKRRLERAVREQEVEHQRQINAMRRLLAGGGHLLVDTLNNGKSRLALAADILTRRDLGRADIDAAFRQVHTVQGEARAFDLGELGTAARALEDYLALLRSRARTGYEPDAEDRRVLRERLNVTFGALDRAVMLLVEASPIGAAIVEQVTVRRPDLQRVVELTSRRSDELAQAVQRLAARPFGEALLYLTEAVPSWGERYGKQVLLDVEGRDAPIPAPLARVLPSVLTHLARNAVVHGIEPASEREAAGKEPRGTLRARAELRASGLEILFSDDGRGLDRAAVEARAKELGLSGPVEELVFSPGVSTQKSELSGLGVGLDAVREHLAEVGYAIEIAASSRSERTTGTEFRIFAQRAEAPGVAADERARA